MFLFRSQFQQGSISLAGAILIILPLAVLCGWWADIVVFKSVLDGFPEMKPAGAGGFFLVGLALVLSGYGHHTKRFRWLPAVSGCIIAIGGIAVLAAYTFQISSPIDTALIPNLDPASTHSRVSPVSAINFIFLGAAIILARSRGFGHLCGVLATFVITTAYASLLGHLYSANTFYGLSGINGMPLHTAFLFMVAAVALLSENREFPLVELLASDSLGGASARRLVPVVIVLPTLIGWLRLTGEERGLYDTGFGGAAAILVQMCLLLMVGLIFSARVHRSDMNRRQAEAELADKEMRYRELFDYSQGLICVHDLEGRLSTVNRATLHLLGYSQDEMIGRNLREFVAAPVRPEFDAYLREVTHEGLANGLLELESKDGKRVVLRYYNVLAAEEGKEPYVLGHAQNVTELLEAQKKLNELSLTDELTGLYNRRGFVTMAEHQLKLERHSGTARGLSLMFADMDGLKAINDTYGHEAGSHAIKTLGRLISSVVRNADLVARWGGDEFVILSVGAHGENAQLVVDRILERIDEHNAESPEPYLIACSIGLAAIDDDLPLDELIAQADKAMYAEKRRRKIAAGDISDPPQSFVRPWTEHSPRY